MQSDYGIEKNLAFRPHLLCVQAHCTLWGRGEVIEHWLAGLPFWARSLAGDLTGSRPCLCDVLVPAYTAIRVIQRRRKLIEKRPAIFATNALARHLTLRRSSCQELHF